MILAAESLESYASPAISSAGLWIPSSEAGVRNSWSYIFLKRLDRAIGALRREGGEPGAELARQACRPIIQEKARA
jgi:hypothetical protein